MSTERQRQIAKLRERVTERRQEKWNIVHLEGMQILLSSVASIQLLEFLPWPQQITSAYEVQTLMRQLSYNGIVRPAVVARPGEIEDLRKWASNWFQKFKAETEYLLGSAAYWNSRWAKVRTLSTSNWLGDVWRQTDWKDIIVLTADQKSAFGIIKEENTYDCYICETAELLKFKDTYIKYS